MAESIIKPQLPSGVRDVLPQEAEIARLVTEKITEVYRRFGYQRLETSIMQRWGVLTGNVPTNKSIYQAKVVRGIEDAQLKDQQLGADDTALRFDLTVPLARFISAHPDTPKPFRRYELGRVFRGEQAQAGRFREFTQLDFDIIGSRSILADVEVLTVMYEVFIALGISDFTIRFNSRNILNGLSERLGVIEKSTDLFRVIDKLDKIGLDAVLEELQRTPDVAYDTSALGLSSKDAGLVKEFLEIQFSDPWKSVASLENFFTDDCVVGKKGVTEIQGILKQLSHLGILDSCFSFDLTVARGLDYYSGPVFEAVINSMPELGSVFSGGRFDGLVDRFIPDSNMAGVGASVGLDRMIIAMQNLGLTETHTAIPQVLVTVFNQVLESESCTCAYALRQNGIQAELYLGDDTSLRGQIAYAAKKGFPYVIVIGPDENEKNLVQLKDMRNRGASNLTMEACIDKIQSV